IVAAVSGPELAALGSKRKRNGGVQILIYEVLESASVEVVGARLHGDVEQTAARLPIFGGVVARLHGHLLNGVRVGHVLHNGESHCMVGVVQPFDAIPGGVGGRSVHDHVEVREVADAGQKHGGVI